MRVPLRVCVNVNVNARATLISVKAVPLLHPFRIMFFITVRLRALVLF